MADLAAALAQAILPSSCLSCLQPLPWEGCGGVCPTCWEQLESFQTSCCGRCAHPSQLSPCLRCQQDPPPWTSARAFGPYQGQLQQLILACKNGHDQLATPFARLLFQAWRRHPIPQLSALVPVPISPWRRWQRGYNQAELLSAALAAWLGVPVRKALRRRGFGSQKGRSRADRFATVERAFSPRRPVAGTVLLVDDVLTTGATAAACARALQRAGAGEVHVLTLARTVKE